MILTNQISQEKVVDLLSDPGHYHQATNDGQKVLEGRETDKHYIIEKTGSPQWKWFHHVHHRPISNSQFLHSLANRRGERENLITQIGADLTRKLNCTWIGHYHYLNTGGELNEMKVILLIYAVMKRKWIGKAPMQMTNLQKSHQMKTIQ